MEILRPTSKAASVRQIGIMIFFILMLVGIESKIMNTVVDVVSMGLAITIGCCGFWYLMTVGIKWKNLPLVTNKERITKIVVFCSVFLITLGITQYQIVCYVIALAVIGYRGITTVLSL